MTNLPEPNGNKNDPLEQADNTPESASLIRVPASEQQQPGALWRCPVCGTSYGLGAEPVSKLLPESSSLESAEAAQPAESSGLRVVLRCPQCGTYSVGEPPAE
jgi:rubrerythrin